MTLFIYLKGIILMRVKTLYTYPFCFSVMPINAFRQLVVCHLKISHDAECTTPIVAQYIVDCYYIN